jgi:hypothetical protein
VKISFKPLPEYKTQEKRTHKTGTAAERDILEQIEYTECIA